MKLNKRILSLVLVLCMMLSCVAVGSFTANAVTVTEQSVSSGDQGPQSSIRGSAILHCFDWSYNSIKANLADIAAAGYTAVQTSPVQPPKDYSASYTDNGGQWWKLYQPLGVSVADGNSWLGTKAELRALCEEADRYGIKVVCDIVANHLADNGQKGKFGYDYVSSSVESAFQNRDYWHNDQFYADDDSNRYKVTHGMISLPDLNTGNSYVMNRYKDLCIELINLGVDGFRFDAAKHIELPGEDGGSDFWPTVINGSASATGKDIFYYGEILNYAGTAISNYTRYMAITDNQTGDGALVAANSSDATWLANSTYEKGATAANSVIWAESHDTYMGDSGSKGISNTSGVPDSTVIKAWAIVGSRANSTALYFARPPVSIGQASTNTTYKCKAVAEVNKFKNFFDGTTEYLSSENGVAYNERGTEGVVISKLSGGGQVNLTAHKMAAGTYKDQVSGNTFTVSGGKISGNVGDTGVAVVYNATEPGPTATVNPGSQSYKTDTLTLTLTYSNATSGSYSIDGGAYENFTTGKTITIGSGASYGTVTTVKVKATNGSQTSAEKTFTYTKQDPNAGVKVYFDNSSYNWSAVNAYIYISDTQEVSAWPGEQMTYDSATGYYVIDIPDGFESAKVIFTESASAVDHRYPADGEQGMSIGGSSKLFGANYSWTEFTAPVPTTVKPTVAPTTAKPTVAPTTVKPTVAPTTVPAGNVLIGDANQDGSVTISDATEIQRHLAGFETLTGDGATAADTDKDNSITITDATLIQKYLVYIRDDGNHTGEYTGNTQPTTAAPTTIAPTTVAPTTAPVGNYVYYKNTNNWSAVKAYYWSESNTHMVEWPGVSMDSVGNNVYRVEVPSDAEKIIFDNGNSGTGNQTENITLEGYGKIYMNGAWSDYVPGQDPTTPVPTDSGDKYTIYFTNNAGWSGTIRIAYWGGSETAGWPGVEMTNVSGLTYVAYIPKNTTTMMFSNGSSLGQTGEVSVTGSGSYETDGQESNGWYKVKKVS